MKVLVVNRGEIACRVMHTLREMGIASVAVHSDEDRDAPHVWLADEAVALSAPTGYLSLDNIMQAAQQTHATAIHPGYGFLSQSPAMVRACAANKLVFIGPSADAMVALGDKRAARIVAEKHGVPVVPGAESCDTLAEAQAAADKVGYPVLIKAAGGGGGKGMRRVEAAPELAAAYAAAQREAKNAFADDRLLVEKYVFPARHVEVQIFGDGKHAVALGERECSLQRRYQKIIEESPSPGVKPAVREALFQAAVTLAEAVGYANAGTVEFLLGPDDQFFFLEVNTRLQVEHPVTEMLTGLDLVRTQIELAHGGPLPPHAPPVRGHAIEARLNAEDAYGGFLPAVGHVLMLQWPHLPQVRVDAGIAVGSTITPNYDPMLAKIIAWAPERDMARRRLITALRATTLLGVMTNQTFLMDVLERDFYKRGDTFTTTIEAERWQAPDVPDYVAQAAALAGAADTADDGGAARPERDAFSPWQNLGPFRMGTGVGHS